MFGLGLGSIKWIAIGLVLLACIAYVTTLKLEVSHYKASAQKWEQKYTTYKTNTEANILALGESNKALTLQFKQSSIEVMKLQNEAKAKLQERIKGDAVSRSINIPASVLQLQHDTTTNSTNVGESTNTVGGPAPDTQSTSESNGGGTVNDLLAADAINNPELNSCVDEVIRWNKFWDDFVINVKATERVNTQ